jgi:c(7)-type cytochrome triheme protein
MLAQVRPGAAAPTAAAPSPAAAATPAAPAAAVTAQAPAEGGKGRTVYQSACAACHTTGAAGAPKLGDSAAWAPRIKTGITALHTNALKGKGAMPPKGGNASLADADVRAAVDFLVAQARESGAAPAAAAAAPATPASPPIVAPAAPAPPVVAVAPAPPTVQAANDPNAFNRLMTPVGKRNAAPADDGIHDPGSPGTMLLQAPLASFTTLARSNTGNYVDWVAALGKKQIQPRWDARDLKAEPTVMDLNIVREVKGTMPDVVFPHKQHTEWLDCANCHPAIFIPQKGANQISMAAIMLGQKCGVCHGKVAFPVSECRLCHSRAKTTTTAGEGKR